MLLPAPLDAFVFKTLRTLGYQLIKHQRLVLPTDRRKRLLESYLIDLVIDVGANVGQYGKSLRRLGYKGTIVSFEPMKSAFRELSISVKSDPNWHIYPFGLSESESHGTLHIAGNSISSSILAMLPEHEKFAPKSRFISTEKINLCRLDDIFGGISKGASNVWLKLDVQGYEDRVLRGAQGVIKQIKIIQTELSFRPLYAHQASLLETIALLDNFGFTLVGLEPGFMDCTTGELLQADGIFRSTKI